MSGDAARSAYNRDDIVALYDKHRGLQEPERVLFDAWLKPGIEILDVGVGGGRTTPHLAALAKRYVGIDFSDAMVRRCRERFPELTFGTMDATAMTGLADASFDAVVFSFNGIDSIPTAEGRDRCLAECARVLRGGGVFLFSTHNASHLVYRPVLAGVGPLRAAWRVGYAVVHTLANLAFRVPSPALWKGHGHVWDFSTDGGLRIHVARPEHVTEEAGRHGLEVKQIVGVSSARLASRFTTPWYYYACVKESRRR